MSLRRWHCAWIFLLLHIHYKQGEPENPAKRETETWVSYFAHGWCELSKRSVLARPQWFRKNPSLDLCKPHWPFHVCYLWTWTSSSSHAQVAVVKMPTCALQPVQVEARKPPYGVQVQTCFNNGSGHAAAVAAKIKSWSNDIDISCSIKICCIHKWQRSLRAKVSTERERANLLCPSCWDELSKRFFLNRDIHQVPPG